MNWNQLLSSKRFGMETYSGGKHDDRSEFQRDYDRLIFSAPFRRLQNKTQVFPLPGSVFVHNRLTHSLEVACVGRSIGNAIVPKLNEKYHNSIQFINDIGAVTSAACLAHDLGNPPFGHSGEQAIATYFSEGNGNVFNEMMTTEEWADLTHFEGNANTFRLLTHQFEGRRKGGFALTYSTLAAIVKYPYESQFAEKNKIKFGFFQSEKESYKRIADDLGIVKDPENSNRYARHPLVYLVEAADDICYLVMDIEDAHKLKIITTEETKEILMQFMTEQKRQHAAKIFANVHDANEQIGYLRSVVIGLLVDACTQTFIENEENILNGTFRQSLIKQIDTPLKEAYQKASNLSKERIYSASEVLDIELSGYKIITMLMDSLMEAVFHPEKSYSKRLLMRIPSQYATNAPTPYGKAQAILDYVSGMTDIYALDLYQKIMGMSLPTL